MAEEKKKKSWKTTILGMLLLIGSLATAIAFALDGDTETQADWQSVLDAMKAAGITLTGVAGALLGRFSRDDNVDDESAGAK